MIYFWATIFSIILPVASFYFYKAYQLCGYNLGDFFETVFTKGLPFGRKNKLVFTKRLVRFVVVYLVICAAILFPIFVCIKVPALIFVDTLVVYIFWPLIFTLAHLIVCPIEQAIKCFYIVKARKKLKGLKTKVIGITGSFGKTSTKDILFALLEKEFKVCKTPLNYNTEMGLTKTILNSLDDCDFLIAEMGARREGDIKKLCKIANPDVCLVTTVGNQHLQTFHTLDAIERTKAEIVLFSKPDATVFVNCDSPASQRIYKSCSKNKFCTCKYNGYAFASEVEFGSEGSQFYLNLDGDKFKLQTSLLGRHNVHNIVLAAAVAHYLGVSKQDIIAAVSALKATPHRLQLIKNGSINILDDSYNSNCIGAKEALAVLASFDGKKIVVTPGFVELGQRQSEENFKLGANIADVADFCVIMNETNKNYILSGLISHNFDKNKIFFACNASQRQKCLEKLVTSGSTVLFENDLPDNYK